MKRVLVAFLVLVSLLVPALSFGEEELKLRKDPILAGALSWYVPGLGQFYAGAIFKGATFMVVEYALLYSTIISIAEVELGLSGGISLGLKISSKRGGATTSERTTAIVLGTTLIIIHFVNIIDAVNTTRKYNEEQGNKLQPEIQFDNERQSYKFGLSGHF